MKNPKPKYRKFKNNLKYYQEKEKINGLNCVQDNEF